MPHTMEKPKHAEDLDRIPSHLLVRRQKHRAKYLFVFIGYENLQKENIYVII